MKTSEIRELTVAEIEERIDAEKANLLRQKAQPLGFSGREPDHIEKGTQGYCPHDDDPCRKAKRKKLITHGKKSQKGKNRGGCQQ